MAVGGCGRAAKGADEIGRIAAQLTARQEHASVTVLLNDANGFIHTCILHVQQGEVDDAHTEGRVPSAVEGQRVMKPSFRLELRR